MVQSARCAVWAQRTAAQCGQSISLVKVDHMDRGSGGFASGAVPRADVGVVSLSRQVQDAKLAFRLRDRVELACRIKAEVSERLHGHVVNDLVFGVNLKSVFYDVDRTRELLEFVNIVEDLYMHMSRFCRILIVCGGIKLDRVGY